MKWFDLIVINYERNKWIYIFKVFFFIFDLFEINFIIKVYKLR